MTKRIVLIPGYEIRKEEVPYVVGVCIIAGSIIGLIVALVM